MSPASKDMMAFILQRGFNTAGVAARLYRFAAFRTPLAGALAAALALTSLAPVLAAQLRTTKPAKGPRAIAVIRWQPNAQGKAVPRLLPVVILLDGKYYDAGLFRATPRPMALEPGVVYEAQDKGDLLGYFTVKNASRNAAAKTWVGLGEWQGATRSSPELELRERTQTAELVKEKPAETSPIFTESVDDRDIKKKSTVYDEEGREIPAGQEPEEDGPPTLKRKPEPLERNPRVAPPEKKKEAPVPTSADDDPERPRLKRGGQATTPAATTAPPPDAGAKAAPAASAAAPKTVDDDPNRPILRRGGAGQQKTGTGESEQSPGMAVPGRVQARGDVPAAMSPASGFATRTFEAVAVSDAEVAPIRDDYRFQWTESEREQATAKMRKLAQVEIAKFLQQSGQRIAAAATATKAPASRAAQRGQVAAPLELANVQVTGLDLDANNSAELVLTGRGRLESGKTLYVTLVARTDVDGNPRKLFAAVTMSDRLDLSPRLELVDAVDADGDRRGELLFRRIRETSAEFVLYRVGTDQLTELFRGGNAE
ncbi:MAG: hypothetical protein ABIP12_05615 [Terriglobales bacterium]